MSGVELGAAHDVEVGLEREAATLRTIPWLTSAGPRRQRRPRRAARAPARGTARRAPTSMRPKSDCTRQPPRVDDRVGDDAHRSARRSPAGADRLRSRRDAAGSSPTPCSPSRSSATRAMPTSSVAIERDLALDDALGDRQRELHHLPLGPADHLAAQRRRAPRRSAPSRRSMRLGARAPPLRRRPARPARSPWRTRRARCAASRCCDLGARGGRARRRADGRARRRGRATRLPVETARRARSASRRALDDIGFARRRRRSTIRPSSSSLRAMATISCCAFSTSRSRTAPSTSISSFSRSAARFDMLAKKRLRMSSLAPLSATVSDLLVGALDDLAHAVVLDVAQVVEHEHQVADRHRQVGRVGFDRLEHRLADVAIEAVEQLGDGADAAALLAARRRRASAAAAR